MRTCCCLSGRGVRGCFRLESSLSKLPSKIAYEKRREKLIADPDQFLRSYDRLLSEYDRACAKIAELEKIVSDANWRLEYERNRWR